MSTEQKKLYCISGLIQAAESSARDTESYEALTQELKANHIPETINLITESSFQSIMAGRCAADFLSDVIDSILTEYDKLGFMSDPDPEDCIGCSFALKGGL